MNTLALMPSGINTIQTPSGLTTPSMPDNGSGQFSDILMQQLQATNEAQQAAQASVQAVEDGNGDINNAVLDMQKASLMFSTTHAVTQKLMTAYSDIMNTQI